MSRVPEWALELDEFWLAIRRRNLWFIKLRYGFVLVLLALIILSITLFKIRFTPTQLTFLFFIDASILIYNVILHWIRSFVKFDPLKFNPMYISLFQMVLDLSSLSLLVYITGGIESPLYMFFVFHMIIGSLILPGAIVYTIASVFVILFTAMISFEHAGILFHHHVDGLLNFHLYDNIYFVAAYLVTFTFMIFVSIYLSNGIAKQLYKREKDLVESIKKINSAEKEKQKYIMGVVHEIKTPIAAVTSYLELILQKFLGPIDEKVEEKLLRAKTRSDEAIQMINDVLNVSKLNLYDQFDVEEIDVKELIGSVIKRRKSYASSRLIEVSFKDRRQNPRSFFGDRYLLDIVFSNLIGNAIKYGVEGGLVEIVLDSENEKVMVEVCDDGMGIPKDDIPKIFNDFYRASNIKKIFTEGSGLGLSIVKKVVDRHGGIIKVESPSRMAKKDQPGASFRVFLPIRQYKLEGKD
jgi:signal transduction histidine kinase